MLQRAPNGRALTNALRRGARHPTWLGEAVRRKIRSRSERGLPFSLAEHAAHLDDLQGTLTTAYGIPPDECLALRSRVRIPSPPVESAWSGRGTLLGLVGSLVLATRPSMVLEVGVAMGFTTAVILSALDDNGDGTLHSVDLPPLQVDAGSFIGKAVPSELRSRWSLHVGPARTMLPTLARQLAPIDIFVQDADHSYAGQYEDFQTVWPHLQPGGALICDDVCNPALMDFAAEMGVRPYLVGQVRDAAAVGLLLKSR
jgi:predicted O-methyltransferase YrrM